jgi:hypothetical protein
MVVAFCYSRLPGHIQPGLSAHTDVALTYFFQNSGQELVKSSSNIPQEKNDQENYGISA